MGQRRSIGICSSIDSIVRKEMVPAGEPFLLRRPSDGTPKIDATVHGSSWRLETYEEFALEVFESTFRCHGIM